MLRARAPQVFCYAINPDSGSAVRAATAAAAEHFVDVNALSAAEAAERIAADGVQVLVNLGGYTQYMRNEIFALRPAPVQVRPKEINRETRPRPRMCHHRKRSSPPECESVPICGIIITSAGAVIRTRRMRNRPIRQEVKCRRNHCGTISDVPTSGCSFRPIPGLICMGAPAPVHCTTFRSICICRRT